LCSSSHLILLHYPKIHHLDALLVGLGRSVVLVLVELVRSGVETTAHTAGNGGVASIALHLLLVGLLAGFAGIALESLGNVVAGVLDGINGLSDDGFIRLIDVWGRHVDVWLMVG